MTQFEIFAGIDWSTKTHQVVAVDADGEILGERAFAHSGEGLAEMTDWILGHSPDAGAEPPLYLFHDKPNRQNHRRKAGRPRTQS